MQPSFSYLYPTIRQKGQENSRLGHKSILRDKDTAALKFLAIDWYFI